MGALKKIAHQCRNCSVWLGVNERALCNACTVALANLDEEVAALPKNQRTQPK